MLHSHVDPCEGVECAPNARCKVHRPTEKPFCEPSCSINDGGCTFNQECSLLQPPCLPDLLCPPVVVCAHVGQCTTCAPHHACVLEPAPCLIPPCPEFPRCLEQRCGLKLDPGPCEAAIPRWNFNPKTRRCERFVYGGCFGNENNFETLEECEKTCEGKKLYNFTHAF